MSKKKSPKNRRSKKTSHPVSRKATPWKKNQKKPTISVCIMVKNEEALLPQCLASIKEFVDEIIVVDTGSTDETVAIAERFAAKIYHHPWENDFSKHRNQSLSYATGDWILVLDADEELVAGSGQKLRQTVREGRADYYFCSIFDIDRRSEVTAAYNMIRLFRNNMGMTYTRRIHNQLQVKGKSGYTKISVNHFGYDLSSEKMEAKHVRTTSLLRRTIEENPEDGYSYHQLTASCLKHLDYSTAVEYGEKALNIRRRKNQRNAFYINTFYLVAAAYFKLNDFETALRIGLEAKAVFCDHLDTCHILASIYFKQNSFEKCKKMTLRYLDIYNQLEENPSRMGRGTCYCFSPSKRSQILSGLAYLHFLENEYQAAESYFHQAFVDAGKQMQTAENIYRFYLTQRMGEQALRWLVLAHETGCAQHETPQVINELPSLYLKIAEYYLQSDDPEATHQCLEFSRGIPFTLEQQMEKKLLQIRVFWIQGAIEDLVGKLESLLTLLGIRGDRRLNSLDDLAGIFYDMSELFTEQQQWHLAEPTLKLAIQIAPACFEPARFQSLLASAEQ